MRNSTLLTFSLIFASLPTASRAQDAGFTFEPPSPRSTQTVSIGASYLSSCFAGGGRAEVAGRRIHLTAFEGCVCAAVLPFRVTVNTTVGPLAAGAYEVDLVIAPDPRDPECSFEPMEKGSAPLTVAAGEMRVRLLPAAPTDAAPVTVRVRTNCPSAFALPSRQGNLIRVDEIPSLILAPCTDHPTWTTDLSLGELPAGAYTLVFFGIGEDRPAVTHVQSFRVRRGRGE